MVTPQTLQPQMVEQVTSTDRLGSSEVSGVPAVEPFEKHTVKSGPFRIIYSSRGNVGVSVLPETKIIISW